MAETIDETTLVAWVDGELDEAHATEVARAVAANSELAALADRHRALKARFAAAFDPIALQPAAMPTDRASAPVASLDAARARRDADAAMSPRRWWGVGGAIAASLLVGVLAGHDLIGPGGVAGEPGAPTLPAPITQALDGQLAGEGGAVRVALSFKDRAGGYCRSFAATDLSGVACRDGGDWRLRYAAPASIRQTDYRMAGTDADEIRFIQSAIVGEPLDRDAELKARASRWAR